MTKRGLIIAAAVVVVVLGGAVWVTSRSGYVLRVEGGPLACPDCGSSGLGLPVGVGELVAVGAAYPRNRGTRDVVIEGVQLVDAELGLKLVHVVIVEPNGKGHGVVGLGHTFPPPEPGGTIRPLAGYVLRPDRQVQILLGVRVSTIP